MLPNCQLQLDSRTERDWASCFKERVGAGNQFFELLPVRCFPLLLHGLVHEKLVCNETEWKNSEQANMHFRQVVRVLDEFLTWTCRLSDAAGRRIDFSASSQAGVMKHYV